MKGWSTAIFPIAVLTTIAAITYLLAQTTKDEEPKNNGQLRHDPDYIISNMKLSRLDKSGNLQYTLTSKTLTHFPNDDSSDVEEPNLIYLNPSKSTLNISSRFAHVTSEGETVYMKDDVHLVRAATPTRQELNGYMPDLTVKTNDETATTESAVRFTQGKSSLNGTGMDINNKTETYILKSRVVGFFESKSAQNKN